MKWEQWKYSCFKRRLGINTSFCFVLIITPSTFPHTICKVVLQSSTLRRLSVIKEPDRKWAEQQTHWTIERRTLHGVNANSTHLNCQAYKGNYGHGWNSATAFLPDQSLCGRSSWSWKQWQAPEARSSAHRQWHTGTLLFFPTHLLACWSDQSSR